MDESHKHNLSEKGPRQKYKTICFHLDENKSRGKQSMQLEVNIVVTLGLEGQHQEGDKKELWVLAILCS